MRALFRSLYDAWLARRLPAAPRIILNQRRIFIFPTFYGFLYLMVCVLLFIGGINYENNLIMALSFLMASLFVVAILHTYSNLSGLGVRNGSAESGFAGETGGLQVVVFSERRAHRGIWLSWLDQEPQQISVEPREEVGVWLNVPLVQRGRAPAPRLMIESRYPLGLLKAWSWATLAHHCLAWPRPLASDECPADGGIHRKGSVASGKSGNEEFQGLRAYRPGDSLRKVDWKGYARGRGLNTKLFEEPAGGRLWLRWELLPGVPEEQRLSTLCYWALRLDEQGMTYGLSLPGLTLAPDRDDVHRWRALDALASYPEYE